MILVTTQNLPVCGCLPVWKGKQKVPNNSSFHQENNAKTLILCNKKLIPVGLFKKYDIELRYL